MHATLYHVIYNIARLLDLCYDLFRLIISVLWICLLAWLCVFIAYLELLGALWRRRYLPILLGMCLGRIIFDPLIHVFCGSTKRPFFPRNKSCNSRLARCMKLLTPNSLGSYFVEFGLRSGLIRACTSRRGQVSVSKLGYTLF